MFSRRTDDETEAPQREVENLIGWRKMKILPVGLLVSPFREGGMTSVLSEEAVCDRDPKHDAPEGDCVPGCGWYAFYEAKELYISRWSETIMNMDDAIVEVSAGGKTWLHDKGFRTKQIRMESLWVPKGTDAGLSETLGEMYDLPVYEIPGQREMEDARATDTANQERKGVFGSTPVPTKDFTEQLIEGLESLWKSESGKSSSQPSQRSEPSGKSPLTSAWERRKSELFRPPLSRSPSPYHSKQVREQAEYDLARARAELSKALGQCILCDKQGVHGHDDLNELMEKPNG